jgi:predicted metalloprotease with PDZ domain
MSSDVEYRIDLMQRHAHLYSIEARFPVAGEVVDLKLPVWTPGSYLVREFERHLQDLAVTSSEGAPLPVTKIDKCTWRVDARAATVGLVARYRVYAWDLTVRSAHLDDTHGFWNGACVFLYADALRARPHRVTVIPPQGWQVTVGLDADGDNRFRASSYDELVDSPFEVGTHELLEFSVEGKRHRLAIWGRVDTPREQLKADFTKIVETARALFGEPLPYSDYTFILLSSPNQYGGLEHARSCALLTTPFSFAPRKKYEEFLELVSHEFFHLWNVKRIHPAALGPFDYQREAYTRSLWVMEGVTSYYDRNLLVRAGLQPAKRYLDKLGEELGKIANTPGRLKQSLEESSFDAWIKLYRPDENSVNSTISYYLKGGWVALLLDLTIRARTDGRRSLDDVMRLLWQRHGKSGEGFADGKLQSLVEEAAGVALDDFFAAWVRGREDVDANPILAGVGLCAKPASDDDDEEKAPAVWIGANLKDEGAGTTVSSAIEGGPAVAAGIYAGDDLIALDGFRVDCSSLKERLATRRPGERVQLTLFRRDELRTVSLTLAERPPEKFSLAPVENPSDAQKAAFKAWLGCDLPAEC